MGDEDKARLPIKVVFPQQRDYYRPAASGSKAKVFEPFDRETRDTLVNQLHRINQHFATRFDKFPGVPAVARVILKEKALAKSHRPYSLLHRDTCDIIGVRGLGELLVSVKSEGLNRLADKIMKTSSHSGIAAISTISSIKPYDIFDVSGPKGLEGLKNSMRMKGGLRPIKLRLFLHHDTVSNEAVLKGFKKQIAELNLPFPEQLHYSDDMRIYRFRETRSDSLESLAEFLGTQSLTIFPQYQVLQTQTIPLRPASEEDFPLPNLDRDYPLVGIIDTGTDPNNNLLSPWVAVRDEEYVPKIYRSYEHGSFVAGLVVHPRLLNGGDPRFPGVSAKIVDVVAIPKNGAISEDELLTILEGVLRKYPEVRIWNLSLATRTLCEDQVFSDLAIALDSLQDEHGVIFALAAGNYENPPFRGWPPEDLGEADRICSPSDSVRGVTVGSLAHQSRPNSRVDVGDPSPFSRRGPGPVFSPKPEVVHYGGNCDHRGNYTQTGVISLDGRGNVAENIGTSFATPMIASLLANVTEAFAEPPSLSLVRALVVHSAVLNSNLLTTRDMKYRGFGVPDDLVRVFTCAPWSATLILEPVLYPGQALEKWPFPIPTCLRGPGDTVHGEIVMTLVYNPPLDAAYGSEYCRSNVEVSLGTYDLDHKQNKRIHIKKVPPEPRDISKRYERYLVEHGFKWSPVKVYRRLMFRVSGSDWRLLVKMLNRGEYFSDQPQQLALIVSLIDPERKQPVYDEVVRLMNLQGWVTADVQIKERIRAMV